MTEHTEYWREHALPHINAFVKEHYEFSGEELADYVSQKIGPPPHPNLIGSVFKTMVVDQNLAILVGTAKAKHKAAKGRMIGKWRSTVFVPDDAVMSVRGHILTIKRRVYLHHITVEQGLYEAYRLGAETSV